MKQATLIQMSLIKTYWEKINRAKEEIRSSFNMDLLVKVIEAKNK